MRSENSSFRIRNIRDFHMNKAIIITHDKRTYNNLKSLLKILFPEVDVSLVLNGDSPSEKDLIRLYLNRLLNLRMDN